MKKLVLVWQKEIKNSVPFIVYVNGEEAGLIKRGENLQLQVNDDDITLYFVPKAPRWFGWKALKMQVHLQEEEAGMAFGVENRYMGQQSSLHTAVNVFNQFHAISTVGLEIVHSESIKKY